MNRHVHSTVYLHSNRLFNMKIRQCTKSGGDVYQICRYIFKGNEDSKKREEEEEERVCLSVSPWGQLALLADPVLILHRQGIHRKREGFGE